MRFYWHAVTKYQLHSPFVFGLAQAVLEDGRWYYAFRDVEQVREKMLESSVKLEIDDFGTAHPSPPAGGSSASVSSVRFASDELKRAELPPAGGVGGAKRYATVRLVARRAGSSIRQGRMLFRLANWAAPATMLELGTSLGIGAMYLASGMRSARFVSLEGCTDCAQVARTNLELLGLKNAEVVTGEFGKTLPKALDKLQKLDFVFFDGNHRPEPVLHYFETCLALARDTTVFVFDDAYWSSGMTQAWEQIKQHPRVTLTVDFFDLSLAFINPEFREKQHFSVVPATWKPWRIY